MSHVLQAVAEPTVALAPSSATEVVVLDDELLFLVVGGAGPNGGWMADLGPNGSWTD